jgi:hypothetical protein
MGSHFQLISWAFLEVRALMDASKDLIFNFPLFLW